MRGKTGFRLLAAVLLTAASAVAFYGQAVEVEIKVNPQRTGVEVTGKFIDGGEVRNISFEREFAGVSGLADRISGLKLFDSSGGPVDHKAFVPGEYRASRPVSGFSYAVDLKNPTKYDETHVSWFRGERGVLFLADLLPLALGSSSPAATVRISGERGILPNASCTSENSGIFRCADRARAVFAFSDAFRTIDTGDPRLLLRVEGERQFDDDAAAKEAREIFEKYVKLFGGVPNGPFAITLMRLTDATQPGSWQADTRGQDVLIFSADPAFRSQALQTLSVPLRHELFHLWLPNGVDLSGRYDWFYEGAALYTAQRLGVAMNRTRFDDLVSSLSAAMAYDRTAPKGLSLAMAGDTRWSGNARTLYARGMLAAFILDLELLKRSKGRHSLEDVLRKLFSEHSRRKGSGAEATAAIIGAFATFDNTGQLVKEILNRTEPLDLAAALANSGFEFSDSGRGLKVKEKPDSKEKAILNKLGYNNWRKLSSR
ncbi:MAG: hypothetical protein DCC44_04750 [Acidobacteria bacterium]|nr:hypothetical protein [Pyrinomonadaceae bacterium]RIJ94311.1 MAG: hypothetical protein DCC44_04750 [Acidobacteriota bacterium]